MLPSEPKRRDLPGKALRTLASVLPKDALGLALGRELLWRREVVAREGGLVKYSSRRGFTFAQIWMQLCAPDWAESPPPPTQGTPAHEFHEHAG